LTSVPQFSASHPETPRVRSIDHLGVQVPQVYLPRPGIDLHKWAVVARDQYTSEPEYWHDVERQVGSAPSTPKLIHAAMAEYLDQGIVQPHEGIIGVERRFGTTQRQGSPLGLNLEHYDFRAGSATLIRPTQGTLVQLVLIDDPVRTVIEPAMQAQRGRTALYRAALMQGGGQLAGYALRAEEQENVLAALAALADPGAFGARYEMVEIVNSHDPGIEFHGHPPRSCSRPRRAAPRGVRCAARRCRVRHGRCVRRTGGGAHRRAGGHAGHRSAAACFDDFMAAGGAERIDYVHGDDVLMRLATQPGNAGVYLPPIGKSDFFGTMVRGGIFPRKTFSMGNAHEKRFYFEARQIR
jgi:hypothetical protein